MPILTKEQVVEAVFELPEAERAEAVERIYARAYPLHLTQEQKNIIEAEIEAHDRDPQGGVSWDELKAQLKGQISR